MQAKTILLFLFAMLLLGCEQHKSQPTVKSDSVQALIDTIKSQEAVINALHTQLDQAKADPQKAISSPASDPQLPDSGIVNERSDQTGASSATGEDETGETYTDLEISSAFESNKLSADSRFTGRRIRVSGVVEHVNIDITGNAYIDMRNDVACYFLGKPSALLSLRSDDPVTIVGTCTGNGIFGVSFKKCKLLKSDIKALMRDAD